jgi:DNA-binding CsgD family transcriptional regulator
MSTHVITHNPVRNAVSSIHAELHAGGRTEAIVKAREAGYGRDRGHVTMES